MSGSVLPGDDSANTPVIVPANDLTTEPPGVELAHLYSAQRGSPGWGNSQRWGLEGQTPSVSSYDQEFDQSDTDFHSIVAAGLKRLFGRLPLDAPTMTRQNRVSAQLVSLPAARFFNAFGNASGTGHDWSGGAVALSHPWIHQNFNPNMQGVQEAHPATTYDPFPSPSSLYPKVV